MDAVVERERWTNLLTVFEEKTGLIRVPIAKSVPDSIGVTLEYLIGRFSDVETFGNHCDRARQIRQQVSRGCLVIAGQAGNGDDVNYIQCHSSGAERCQRSHIGIVAS